MNWNKLKGAVMSRGLNMVDICKQNGINYSTLWRQKKHNKVTVATVKALKEALNLSNEEVLSIFFEQ